MTVIVVNREQYRTRIAKLVNTPPISADPDDLRYEADVQAHWAKYTCVLIFGLSNRPSRKLFWNTHPPLAILACGNTLNIRDRILET